MAERGGRDDDEGVTPLQRPRSRPSTPWPRPPVWIMLGLVLLAFVQAPGRTTFDTKLDLAVDPAGFLSRALRMWNPMSASGELQNQAYGYLFPIGPFFVAGDLLGLPTWITQRLWCALLLCVGFAGALLLARALRIGTEPARLIGAVGYALAPRIVTEIGPVSAETMPQVLLPWVMLPLVHADRIGSARRAAGLSALAVLCMSGVNGAMVVMALVLPGLWLLTRRWDRAHLRLVLWWCGMVIAATLWWILPLLLLGRYSLPFLDYIESAANTTGPLSLFQVLRGTDQWVAYVVEDTPWWPSGWALIENPVLIAATGLVAAIGLCGLTDRALPERRFLVLAAITGTTLIGIGYAGSLGSPFAEVARQLLDGSLAPLRNVHKFDPVLRLALMLAFVHAVAYLPRWLAARRPRWVPLLAAVLVVTVAAPGWLLMLRPGPGWTEIPPYWRAAMDRVAQEPAARTLLVPSTGFGDYTWGNTIDEPAQPLARSPWAVRNQVPLGSEGNTRLMDSIDRAIVNGRGDQHLADLLARSGIRFLLLRNDIDRTANQPPLATVHAGLARSPGIVRVDAFGPPVNPTRWSTAGTPDRTAPPSPALELYEVRRDVPLAVSTPLTSVPTVSGGPESLLPLMRSGQLAPSTPVVLTGDGLTPGPRLVTDGLRHRERNVGLVRDNLSHTMTPGEPTRLDRTATDLLPVKGERHQTVAEPRGIRSVSASTAASYADAGGNPRPGAMPFAAIDGDPATAWRSSTLAGPDGQWLQVTLDEPRRVDGVDLDFVNDLRVGWPVARITVTTDQGSVTSQVPPGVRGAHRFRTAVGPTRKVRVTVESVVVGRQDGNVGIRELAVPGVEPTRALRAPRDLPAGDLSGFSFTRGPEWDTSCTRGKVGPVRCGTELVAPAEEPHGPQRVFHTSAPADYQLGGTVVAAPGGRAPIAFGGLQVTASTQLGGDVAAGALSALDRDPGTAWQPEVTDLRPTLRLAWGQPRDIGGARMSVEPATGVASPSRVEVSTPTMRLELPVDEHGTVTFPPVRTNQLSLRITGFSGRDPNSTRALSTVPGIGELELFGAADVLPRFGPDTPLDVPCGTGPPVNLDGRTYPTSVTGTLADYLAHRPLPLRVCAPPVALPAGDHDLRTARTGGLVVQDLWLRQPNSPAPPAPSRPTYVARWAETERSIAVEAGPAALLRIPENANRGWIATLDGKPLQASRVDGWQQAWIVPGGLGGMVELRFEPDAQYRWGLAIGAATALAMLGLTVLPVWRRRPPGTTASGSGPVVIAVAVLVAALGGITGVVGLGLCALLHRFRPGLTPWVAGLGMGTATAIAVIARLLGGGLQGANLGVTQALLLVAVSAVAVSTIDWWEPRTRYDARHRR